MLRNAAVFRMVAVKKAEPTLTACVFKAIDGVGQKADTAQEPGPLLLMNLLVIPHTDSDGI